MQHKDHGAARLLASIGLLRRCCSEACLNTLRVECEFESSMEKASVTSSVTSMFKALPLARLPCAMEAEECFTLR
jgi:hypothetical protein